MRKFIFSLIFFLLLIICLFRNSLLDNLIVASSNINDILGEAYIKKANFQLADYDEQILSGGTEKYVLKDNQGKRWLFKVLNNRLEEVNTIIAYRLAIIMGINTPQLLRYDIFLNGEKRPGFLQKKIIITHSFDGHNITPPELKSVLLPNVIFGSLCYIPSLDDLEFLISSQKIIFQIDLNNAFSRPDLPHLCLLEKFFEFYKYTLSDINLRQSLPLLKYIESMNTPVFLKYISKDLRKYNLHSYANSRINMMIIMKKSILRDFSKYCYLLPSLSDRDFKQTSSFLYRMGIIGRTLSGIFQNAVDLMLLKNTTNRKGIEAIASPSAYRCIEDFLISFSFEKMLDTLKESQLINSFSSRIYILENRLITMRYDRKDLREKVAITLYIRQLRTFKENLRKFNTFL